MGVWEIQRERWHFRLDDGWLSLRHRNRVEPSRTAVRLVRAIQTRRAIRFQHHKHEDVDRRSYQRIVARSAARLSDACAGLETDRVDWRELVDLGSCGCYRVSAASASCRAGAYHAAFQPIYRS